MILSLHPKYKKKKKQALKPTPGSTKHDPSAALDPAKEVQRRLLPGLSLPDSEWKPSNEYEKRPTEGDHVAGREVDDLMSQLEGVAAKKREGRPVAADFDGGGVVEGGSNKRPRWGDDAARAPPGDEGGDRGRPRQRENGYGNGDRGGYGGGYAGRPAMDEKPVLYKIYDGKVSGWKDFGAFVGLEGLKGRFEGTSAGFIILNV